MESMHPFASLLAAALITSTACAQSAARNRPQAVLDLDARARVDQYEAALGPIELGIDWLLAHQDRDGRWDNDEFMKHDVGEPCDGAGSPVYDVAATGLVLLALAREGRCGADDRRREPMLRGAAWLRKQQDLQNKGLLGTNAAHDFIYNHALGTIGLCAVAAATGDARSRRAAQNAIRYLDWHRNPNAVWRYQPRDRDNDSSITTWATYACLAAHELRLKVDPRTLANARRWFARVTDEHGSIGYTKPGESSSRKPGEHGMKFPIHENQTLTAAGLFSKLHLGMRSRQDAASIDRLQRQFPTWQPEQGRVDFTYYYFGTEALRRHDGPARAAWNDAALAALIVGLRCDGPTTGSWDPVGPWGEEGGRIHATALAIMTLQALDAN